LLYPFVGLCPVLLLIVTNTNILINDKLSLTCHCEEHIHFVQYKLCDEAIS
jgi:hypothetical protein